MPNLMTLVEFEQAATERMRLAQTPDSTMRHEQLADMVRYELRPLVLRLLASERERCAVYLDTRADAINVVAREAKARNLQNIDIINAADTMEDAAQHIRQMKDHT